MATPDSQSAIQPTNQPTVQPVREFMGEAVEPQVPDSGYKLTIKRFNAAGAGQPLIVHLPETTNARVLKDNPLLMAAVLKDGDPVWQNYDIGFVLVATLYASSLGLDILQGDVYPVQGRTAVSDKAKIKYALQQAIFSDAPEIETKKGPPINIEYESKGRKETWTGPDMTTIVKLHVKGWDLPVVYTADLKSWFKGNNPNWRDNPASMLELRAYAKACERVCPVGTQPEEAPPLSLEPKPYPFAYETAATGGGLAQAKSNLP